MHLEAGKSKLKAPMAPICKSFVLAEQNKRAKRPKLVSSSPFKRPVSNHKGDLNTSKVPNFLLYHYRYITL
jgi:hypothetical protein